MGPLTFEHIPPRSALNSTKVIVTSADRYWNAGPGMNCDARGKELKKGHGRTSLCGYCNNFTGRHYVDELAKWCKWGAELSGKIDQAEEIYVNHLIIFPLQIAKQILTMFVALNAEWFGYRERCVFAKFLLNKDERFLDPSIRFWLYLVAPGPLRNIPVNTTADVRTGELVSGMEFSFPPFGYVITYGSKPLDGRLTDITYFLRHDYYKLHTGSIRLAVLSCHGMGFGDYRNFRNMPSKPKENVFLDFDASVQGRK